MTDLQIEKIQNLNQQDVQELLTRFKDRHEMNVVDVAEIISKLITTLKLDYSAGRPKQHSISGEHLGKVLNVGKGVISQYLSVWNMPQDSRNYLKNYNLSLINAYYVSRIKGKDDAETIKLQKEATLNKSINPTVNGTGKRTDVLTHTINEAQMVLNGIAISYKVPPEMFKTYFIADQDLKKYDLVLEKAKTCIDNLNLCINFISPKISKLPYLRKEVEFCILMMENGETKFCGEEVTKECLMKQIEFITKEINSIELEYKLPHISSLMMMRGNLEKNFVV